MSSEPGASRELKREKFPESDDALFKQAEIMHESERTADVEFAAEAPPMASPVTGSALTRDAYEESVAPVKTGTGAVLGYAALVFAVLSLFVWPSVFGSLSIVTGFIAFTKGSRAIGVWSIVIGLISLVGYFFLVPLYA